MKKVLVIVLLMSGLMAGCSLIKTSETNKTEVLESTSLTGKLRYNAGKAILEHDGKTTALDSYSLNLSTYNDKLVVVTGQYSGETLFVDEIK